MLATCFTVLVGCTVPVQQAPMGLLANPRLAGAVAGAGRHIAFPPVGILLRGLAGQDGESDGRVWAFHLDRRWRLRIVPERQLRRENVLARKSRGALPLLEVRAGAVFVAGLEADQIHRIAAAVANHRVAGAPRDREDRAIRDQLPCFRQSVRESLDRLRRNHVVCPFELLTVRRGYCHTLCYTV